MVLYLKEFSPYILVNSSSSGLIVVLIKFLIRTF